MPVLLACFFTITAVGAMATILSAIKCHAASYADLARRLRSAGPVTRYCYRIVETFALPSARTLPTVRRRVTQVHDARPVTRWALRRLRARVA